MTTEESDQAKVLKEGNTAAATQPLVMKEEEEKEKSFWVRYGLWLLIPVMLAFYFSQDKTVLAEIKHQRQVLPTQVKPVHYNLNLTPDLEKFTYKGVVVIE